VDGISALQEIAANYIRKGMAIPNSGVTGCPDDTYCFDFGLPANLDGTLGGLDQFNDSGTYEIHHYVKDIDTGDLSAKRTTRVYKASGSNAAPPAPTPAFPLVTHSAQPIAPTLLWGSVVDTNPGDSVTYTVWIATASAAIEGAEPDITDPQVVYRAEYIKYPAHTVPLKFETAPTVPGPPVVSKLLNSQTYHWKVEAIDSFGARTSSAISEFTTRPGGANNNFGVVDGLVFSNKTELALTNLSVVARSGSDSYMKDIAVANQPDCTPPTPEAADPRCTIVWYDSGSNKGGYTVYMMPTASLDIGVDFDITSDVHTDLPRLGYKLNSNDVLLNQNVTMSDGSAEVTIEVDGWPDHGLYHVDHGDSLHPHHDGTGGAQEDPVEVIIFGSEELLASELLTATNLKFGPNQASPVTVYDLTDGPVLADPDIADNFESRISDDANNDGHDDIGMVFHMSEIGMDLACTDTELTLTGEVSGEEFGGTDDTLTCEDDRACHN
jgi:hypothetical protein